MGAGLRRLLFVGTPFGAFFGELASELEKNGSRVWRITFNGGDFVATPRRNRVVFSASEESFGKFIEETLIRLNIDGVVTFNDCLPHEQKTQETARRLGLRRYVLENGYLRPFWVTFDRNGVNGHSSLPRNIEFYRAANAPAVPHVEFPFTLRSLVATTTVHFTNAVLLAPILGFDPQYYGDSVWTQARGYLVELLRRRSHPEKLAMQRLEQLANAGNPAFLCLLQKPGDAQLVQHSQYGGNLQYLEEVIASFARHAAADAVLLVKQHPLDYGSENCGLFVQDLARQHGLGSRIIFIRDTSIDVIYPFVRAVVTVNSTGGFASLIKGKPVKCMGNAFYDMAGLTHVGPLDGFWRDPVSPEASDVEAFVNYLKNTSQFNGGFETAAARKLLIPLIAQALVEDSLAHYTSPKVQPSADDEARLPQITVPKAARSPAAE